MFMVPLQRPAVFDLIASEMRVKVLVGDDFEFVAGTVCARTSLYVELC
jgi:hypothetical protein